MLLPNQIIVIIMSNKTRNKSTLVSWRLQKTRRVTGGCHLVYHHDYPRRCAARDWCVYSSRHPVLVVAPDRTGQQGPRHRCLGWISLVVGRKMAQDQDWVSLKTYMDTLGETYLRETMEVSFSSSPHDYTRNIGRHAQPQKKKTTLLLPTRTTPLSPKRARDHECAGQSGQNRL